MLPESKTQNFVKVKDDINLGNVKILREAHSDACEEWNVRFCLVILEHEGGVRSH